MQNRLNLYTRKFQQKKHFQFFTRTKKLIQKKNAPGEARTHNPGIAQILSISTVR
jgi:hypothetical protein